MHCTFWDMVRVHFCKSRCRQDRKIHEDIANARLGFYFGRSESQLWKQEPVVSKSAAAVPDKETGPEMRRSQRPSGAAARWCLAVVQGS